MEEFVFKDYGIFTNGEITVAVSQKNPGRVERGISPSYDFAIRLPGKNVPIGRVSLRIGDTDELNLYTGHIGYGINNRYRGHHYAAKACNLIRPVALDYGYSMLWITCRPDNYPSRRTCELLGCELVEIIELPKSHEGYRRGETHRCRYRWNIADNEDLARSK